MFKKENVVTKSATSIVSGYLNKAIQLKASDIHFQPGKTDLLIRFRVDGVLQEVGKESLNLYESIISRIKVMAGLDTSESRLPQDGRFQKVKMHCNSRRPS
jgi:type II secretory ATPase GspE/PulE/Tfp pilus assembly ATPase PilB-like protein